MKTFQTIVLVVFGLLGVIGLVVFATSGGGGGGAGSTGPVVIWGLLPQEAMDTTLAEATTVNKAFTNATYIEKGAENFGNELAQAIAEGTGPDLIIITQEQLLSERAKLSIIPFESIPERTYLDTYIRGAELFLSDTGTYALPLTVDPLVLYYNRQELTGAGVSSAPSSWEGVNALAQTLSETTPTGAVTKSVIPFGDYVNVRNARAILSTIFFQAGIPITEMEDGRMASVLAGKGETGLSIASAALSFYTQFADPAKTVYSWNRAMGESRALFLAGDLLFYPGFASERTYLEAANPNLEFDMAPLPQPSIAKDRTTYGLIYAAAIPRASYNPDGAAIIAFALTDPSVASYLAEMALMAPAHKAYLTPRADDKYSAIFYEEALRARGWLSPSTSVTDGIFAGMIQNVTSGRRSVPDALQSASESLDAALP